MSDATLAPTLEAPGPAWLCESYTHVTPQTRPNMHNTRGQAYVGGVYQAEGLNNALGELATVLASVAMIVCGYFEFPDLFSEISTFVRSANEQPSNNGS